jgi:hypothetical protein
VSCTPTNHAKAAPFGPRLHSCRSAPSAFVFLGCGHHQCLLFLHRCFLCSVRLSPPAKSEFSASDSCSTRASSPPVLFSLRSSRLSLSVSAQGFHLPPVFPRTKFLLLKRVEGFCFPARSCSPGRVLVLVCFCRFMATAKYTAATPSASTVSILLAAGGRVPLNAGAVLAVGRSIFSS